MKSVKSQNVSKYQILPNNCALFAKKFIALGFWVDILRQIAAQLKKKYREKAEKTIFKYYTVRRTLQMYFGN